MTDREPRSIGAADADGVKIGGTRRLHLEANLTSLGAPPSRAESRSCRERSFTFATFRFHSHETTPVTALPLFMRVPG